MNIFPDMSMPSRKPNFLPLIYTAGINGTEKGFLSLSKHITAKQIEFDASYLYISRDLAEVRKF